MDWGQNIYNGGTVATNWQFLITYPGSALGQASGYFSFFTPYIKDPFLYMCPADPSMVDARGPRVRSYSASQAVGTCWTTVTQNGCPGPANGGQANGPVTGQWLGGEGSDNNCQTYGYVYQTTAQMLHPSPVNLWVFGEEHPDCINDSGMAVQCADHAGAGDFIDMPSNLHNRAGSFSFADGHAEIHKWRGLILGAARFIQGSPSQTEGDTENEVWGTGQPTATGANLIDLNWLQARTSYPISQANWAGYPEP